MEKGKIFSSPVIRSDGTVYPTIYAAAKAFNGNPSNIYACMIGQIQSSYGYDWKQFNGDLTPWELKKDNKNRKPVMRHDGKVYSCVKEAADDVGVNRCALSSCLAGRTKSCGGYFWSFVN